MTKRWKLLHDDFIIMSIITTQISILLVTLAWLWQISEHTRTAIDYLIGSTEDFRRWTSWCGIGRHEKCKLHQKPPTLLLPVPPYCNVLASIRSISLHRIRVLSPLIRANSGSSLEEVSLICRIAKYFSSNCCSQQKKLQATLCCRNHIAACLEVWAWHLDQLGQTLCTLNSK